MCRLNPFPSSSASRSSVRWRLFSGLYRLCVSPLRAHTRRVQDTRERLLAHGQRPRLAGGVRRPQRPGYETIFGEQGRETARMSATRYPRGLHQTCFSSVPNLEASRTSISGRKNTPKARPCHPNVYRSSGSLISIFSAIRWLARIFFPF